MFANSLAILSAFIRVSVDLDHLDHVDHHSLLWLNLQQVGEAKIIEYWGNKIMMFFFFMMNNIRMN